MQKSTRNELADSAGSSITRPSSGIRERAGPRPSQVGKRWAVACFPPGAVGHSPIATTMLRPSMPSSFSSGYSSHPRSAGSWWCPICTRSAGQLTTSASAALPDVCVCGRRIGQDGLVRQTHLGVGSLGSGIRIPRQKRVAFR